VKSIVVPDECVARALELVAEFNDAKGPESARASFFDRVRMVVEALLFSWFVPGHRSGGNG